MTHYYMGYLFYGLELQVHANKKFLFKIPEMRGIL